jgi:hypothetical protein
MEDIAGKGREARGNINPVFTTFMDAHGMLGNLGK